MANNQNELLEMLSKKLNLSSDKIEENAKAGNIEGLVKGLDPLTQQKVMSLLQNPEETRKIMENPAVQSLIRRLGSNG